MTAQDDCAESPAYLTRLQHTSMSTLTVPRVLFAGIAADSGKSLIALAVALELKRQGTSPGMAVTGARLRTAIMHRRVLGRLVCTLDDKVLTPGQILVGFVRAGAGAEMLIVDGHDGIFDGLKPGHPRGSDAQLAMLGKFPVILVLDGKNFRDSLAPMIQGIVAASSGFSVAGVIITRVGDADSALSARQFFTQLFDSHKLPPLLGVVPELAVPEDVRAVERGKAPLVPHGFIRDLAETARSCLNIPRIIQIAESADSLEIKDLVYQPANRVCRLAVADDNCFSECYQDNIDLLRYFGAEIVSFSPLSDSAVPSPVGGVYLPGAFVDSYAAELAEAGTFRASLKAFVERGGVLFAEGGSTAILARRFERADESGGWHEGMNLIPASAYRRPERAGYVDQVTVEESVLGARGQVIKGLSYGNWMIQDEKNSVMVLRAARPGMTAYAEGFSPTAQSVASVSLSHFGSNPEIAKNLIEASAVAEKFERK